MTNRIKLGNAKNYYVSPSAINILSTAEKKQAQKIAISQTKLLNTFELEEIQSLSNDDLLKTQSILRHGETLGIWETPKEWAQLHQKNFLRINIRNRVSHFTTISIKSHLKSSSVIRNLLTQLIDQATIQITKFLVLCRVGPAIYRSTAHRPLDVTTIARNAYIYLPQIAALAINRILISDRTIYTGHLFSAFSLEDFENIDQSQKKNIGQEIKRMHYFHELSMWNDAPNYASLNRKTSVKGNSPTLPSQRNYEPYKPIPDPYVGELGNKSCWIIKNLFENIISILEEVHPIHIEAQANSTSAATLTRLLHNKILKFKWMDASGQEITELPFNIRLSNSGDKPPKKKKSNPSENKKSWPPTSMSQIWGLAFTIQTAHMVVVLLAMAPRASEHLTLERDCITYAKDGQKYANGRTFKLVQQHSGALRDWVIPYFAAQCIEQQTRLIAAAEKLDTVWRASEPRKHLWGRISSASNDRTISLCIQGLNNALRAFAEQLGMDASPGGQNLSSHRFRKTVARLVALAIVEAPKILMDIFGHTSIEMTLYYILQDKDLQGDIETIARELRIMRAKAVVEDMVAAEEANELIQTTNENYVDLGGFGGPKAIRIHAAVQNSREAVHRTGATWGAKNVYELAELLTMQGTTWQLVRPGVVCTKAIGEIGPCNKKKGHPEPSRCQVECSSRLEEAWLQEDVDECIGEALAHYIESGKNGSDLVQSFWGNQVLGNLPRFPGLQKKWLQHDVVQHIVQSAAQA